MSESEDCYFWIDEQTPEDERVMSIMCIPCNKTSDKQGWLWEGSVKGYGPYEYKCGICGKLIHPAPESKK